MGVFTYRHELKYCINVHDYWILRSRIRHLLQPDEHSDEKGEYKIRSIYFDNCQDTALLEKIAGVNYREKYRIRCYNHSENALFLEKKLKRNGMTAKRTEPLERNACQHILNGEFHFLRDSGIPLFQELYCDMQNQGLRPKCIVDYVREAYTFPAGNVRLTFDKELRSALTATDFFNSDLPTVKAFPSNQLVFEVKFDHFLPEIISDLIQTNNRRLESVSKYAQCRLLL